MNKATQRKKPLNRFRFYPVHQKRVAIDLKGGGIFEDYFNQDFLPSSKDSIKSFEASMLATRRIKADYKVMCRYTNTLKNGDRLFYLNDDFIINKEGILRVNSFQDETGRREYLKVICGAGAYAGPATVNPEEINRYVHKHFVSSESEIETIQQEYLNLDALEYGNADAVIVKNDFNNRFLIQTEQSQVIPVIFTFSEFESIQGVNILNDEQINFTKKQSESALKAWVASAINVNGNLPINVKFNLATA